MRRWLLLLAFACGGPQRKPAGDDCGTTASHLVDLAERDNGAASGSLGADVFAELERKCREDHWSDDRRACLLAAPDQDATLDCPLD